MDGGKDVVDEDEDDDDEAEGEVAEEVEQTERVEVVRHTCGRMGCCWTSRKGTETKQSANMVGRGGVCVCVGVKKK